jgi:hypothetical protein
MRDELQRVKRIVADWAGKHPRIWRVHLYGSRLRGHRRDGGPIFPHSDLDLAVELFPDECEACPLEGWIGRRDLWTAQLGSALYGHVDWPVHLELLAPTLTPTVCKYVEELSEIIYEARSEYRNEPVSIGD